MFLVQPRLIHENELGKPTSKNLIKLEISLIYFFLGALNYRVEGLSRIIPGKFQNTCKFDGLGFVINMIDITQFKTNGDLNGPVSPR